MFLRGGDQQALGHVVVGVGGVLMGLSMSRLCVSAGRRSTQESGTPRSEASRREASRATTSWRRWVRTHKAAGLYRSAATLGAYSSHQTEARGQFAECEYSLLLRLPSSPGLPTTPIPCVFAPAAAHNDVVSTSDGADGGTAAFGSARRTDRCALGNSLGASAPRCFRGLHT